VSHTVPPHQRSEKLRIYRAIPEGSQRAKTQAGWIRALDAHLAELVDLGELRSDAAGNIRAIAWIIARHADWKTFVSRPGWDTLTDRTSLSRSTIQRAIRRLREWGFLGTVATGTTWRTRGCDIDDRAGNQGAEYVLTAPAQKPVEISDSPSLGSRREPEKPHASARENPNPKEILSSSRPWPMHQPPRTRGQRLAATQRLQQQAAVLARIPAVRLRSVLKPYFDRGLTPAQVLYALDREPDGTLRWHTADVRHVPGWIRHRLAAWDGHTPPRQLGAGQTTDLNAADVAQLPRADAGPVADAGKHASLARRLLAVTQKRSDKKPVRGLGVNLPGRDGEAPATVVEAPVELGGDGGDWLLRNAARRAEPVWAFGGVDLGAIA
jgi:hypothetical protein